MIGGITAKKQVSIFLFLQILAWLIWLSLTAVTMPHRGKSLHIITKNSSNLRVFRLLAGARRSFVFHPLSQLLQSHE